MKVVPVILAGGIGERFWPLSRSAMPKQLHSIAGPKSMIEETIERIAPLCSQDTKPLIITSTTIAQKIESILPDPDQVILIGEPQGKNTAPAIALAAAWIREQYEDAVMVVVSADHSIAPKSAFIDAAQYAVSVAKDSQRLIVFGIRPSRPETGYGYIELDSKEGQKDELELFRVKRFVEKPSPEKAQVFKDSGNYLWNSGMFVWRSSVIIDEFKKHMPQLKSQMETLADCRFTESAIEQFYRDCCKESIDFGVMEYSKEVAAVAVNFQWDDIGSWESIGRIFGNNDHNTTATGNNIFEQECSDSLIVNKSSSSVAAIGLKNVAVITVDDAVLVIERSRLPQIKKYLEDIKKSDKLPNTLF
ncbi:sugar phosphate nucleotidyltransferase [Chitinispirillales bacterium ANBcel5]|uniref:mannose-1-phosphate guanylyltransferase n=1 Tax=Cellulosispirillum alkaliphilum TaxID=3039283 RepID=UPI002A5457B9|nr:sugar phosphate nucleotidyltransferase [Chitinispirillales bacterium ANBcel5]